MSSRGCQKLSIYHLKFLDRLEIYGKPHGSGGPSFMKKHNIPGKKALEYLERDRAIISPSYPRAHPFMMDHGMGSEVWDVDGNRLIDFASGIGVCSTGHCHPKVVEAIKQQTNRFLHISSDFHHPIWIELLLNLSRGRLRSSWETLELRRSKLQ
jgi:4-aminobutyrate aminotransferase-like enzyme